MDPRVEAIVALIELVRRLGVGHGPTKGERDDLLGGGGDLRGKTPDCKAPGDHAGRPAPRARAPAAGGSLLVRDLGAPDGAARVQEAALRLQSLPSRDPRRAEWEPPRGGARTAPAGAPSLRDHIEKLVKNQCALHESQKSLQLAIRDLSGKVDVLARTIPCALDSITSTQTNLGKNLSYLGRQLSSMESALDRFQARTGPAGKPEAAAPAPDRADLYPLREGAGGGFIFD
ncbi:uncharacterized protein LOC116419736 [Sarcophilus harrisii]|uniref:uncharacterized protein LOC116419736 n=1 Tax=Sarcophilus harrisii TaxID=9305 RepID=UPI001301B6CA|nr:uncharacterized protein LOC116419736 [Sarcophilus harrisii]